MSTSLPSAASREQWSPGLSPQDAATFAEWFACLADPTRVRLLHAVAAVAGRYRSANSPSCSA